MLKSGILLTMFSIMHNGSNLVTSVLTCLNISDRWTIAWLFDGQKTEDCRFGDGLGGEDWVKSQGH